MSFNQTSSTPPPPHPFIIPLYSIVVPILIFLCLLAICANVFILAISCWIPSRRMKPPLKLTLSLAGADAWTSSIIATGLLAHSYIPYVLQITKPKWYDCAAYGLEALRLGGMLTSVLHLFALSLTQYFAAVHPHKYKAWLIGCRLKKTYFTIILLWLIPPALFFAVFGAYSHRTFMKIQNSSKKELETSNCSAEFLDTVGLRLLVFFIVSLPIALMTMVYMKIFCVLTAVRRNSTICGDNSERTPVTCTHSQCRYRGRIRRCRNRVITTLLTVSTFLIGWIPAASIFALTCSECLYPYKELRKNHPATFFTIMILGNLLMISKGLVNPFIYAIRIPEIQDALKLFLRPIIRRGTVNTANGYGTVRVSRSEGNMLVPTLLIRNGARAKCSLNSSTLIENSPNFIQSLKALGRSPSAVRSTSTML